MGAALLPATMLALQLLGFPFGFSPVKPQGEFKNWLLLLEHKDGGLFDVAKISWGWDHRNPLSPWWYMAAKPLILLVPAAPAILHMLAGLFVGISKCAGLKMTVHLLRTLLVS